MTTTATITLGGTARTVELEILASGARALASGVVATIGGGTARYPTELGLYRVYADAPDGSAHQRAVAERWSEQIVTASDGAEWAVSTATVVRNRQAHVVGWLDDLGATNDESQRRSE